MLLQYCDFANAAEAFSFKDTLERLRIIPDNKLYLDWGSFENVDLIGANDLNKFFNDIWYPIADDINVFDQTLNWIVYIRHDGAVYYLKNALLP